MKGNKYQIDLLARDIDGLVRDYEIDDSFFQQIDGLIQRGQVETTLQVESTSRMVFHFHFHSKGIIFVPCDRCLADVKVSIDTEDMLTVKLGNGYSDEGDVVVIPESDGYIDVSQYIYEQIALSLPIQVIHPEGECDEDMITKLDSHITKFPEADDE